MWGDDLHALTCSPYLVVDSFLTTVLSPCSSQAAVVELGDFPRGHGAAPGKRRAHGAAERTSNGRLPNGLAVSDTLTGRGAFRRNYAAFLVVLQRTDYSYRSRSNTTLLSLLCCPPSPAIFLASDSDVGVGPASGSIIPACRSRPTARAAGLASGDFPGAFLLNGPWILALSTPSPHYRFVIAIQAVMRSVGRGGRTVFWPLASCLSWSRSSGLLQREPPGRSKAGCPR